MFMVEITARHQGEHIESAPPLATREQVIARYQQLRAIGREHCDKMLKLVSADAMLGQARRLGLARGKTLILDDMQEMNFVFDLAIHTAEKGRTRTIDRYFRSAQFLPGSDEALTIEAMARARFAILKVVRRHPLAGMIVSDVVSNTEDWLVDLGLEISLPPGAIIATRIFKPESFAMTAGVFLPAWPTMLVDVVESVPLLGRRNLQVAIEDRRFAEAVYRLGLADGIGESVQFQEFDSAAA
jgi:hypothetical protein